MDQLCAASAIESADVKRALAEELVFIRRLRRAAQERQRSDGLSTEEAMATVALLTQSRKHMEILRVLALKPPPNPFGDDDKLNDETAAADGTTTPAPNAAKLSADDKARDELLEDLYDGPPPAIAAASTKPGGAQ